jgi:1-acyl-sn-glycerol-3-phosphate acyltransferase
MRQIGSVVFWLFVVISSIPLTVIAFVIWVVTMPFDKRRVVLHRFTCFWASLYTWANPAWPVTVTGREHIEAGRTYVLVANHLSLLDILVLFRLFKDFKWVSKAEIFKVPGVGWNMRWNKYIALKRGDRESIAEMMAASEETLRSGSSIMIFPEGTRSKTGELKEFKRGAFDMARDTDCAIVPIVIRGTSNALPKHGFILQGRHPISVAVLPEVPLSVVEASTTAELSDHVHKLIADELAADVPQPARADLPGTKN